MAHRDERVIGSWAGPGWRGRAVASALLAAALLAVSVPAARARGPAPGAGQAVAGNAGPAASPQAPAAPAQDTARPRTPRFSHGDHRTQPCASCHSSRVRHGALLIHAPADCQRCHHTGPGRDQCATCHPAAERARPLDRLPRTFRLQVSGRRITRHIPFPHDRHTAVPSCLLCHSNPATRAPDGADCALCHTAHHRPDANCRTCHGAANPRAVHTAAAHPNCADERCHGSRAPAITGSRQACLLCHTDREAHMPGLACSQCHNVTRSETRP